MSMNKTKIIENLSITDLAVLIGLVMRRNDLDLIPSVVAENILLMNKSGKRFTKKALERLGLASGLNKSEATQLIHKWLDDNVLTDEDLELFVSPETTEASEETKQLLDELGVEVDRRIFEYKSEHRKKGISIDLV